MSDDWWKKAVFYQIYPRSFKDSNGDGIGDLQGITGKLDYLKDLGIDAIWFSPFFKSPDYDFGYDISDYCDIDPRYGTMADFDNMLEEAHKKDIKVILDLVVNHTSMEHPWFIESRSSRDNPKRDWYIWRDGKGPDNSPPNNWRNTFFGSAWEWDEKTGQYYLHSFLKEQADINWYNPEVRKAVFDMVRFWLDKGIDGYRLDVAHMYCKDEKLRDNPPFWKKKWPEERLKWFDRAFDANIYYLFGVPEFQYKQYNKHHPETHSILKDFRTILDSYPAKTSVGEVEGEDPYMPAAFYGDGTNELHMNFYFDLMFCRWKASSFRKCIDRWERILPDAAWPAYTFGNHDQTRAISRYDYANLGDKRARVLAMMLLTLRGTPFIYYGEELGMKDPKLPHRELKDPVGIKWYPMHRGRDGERTPMQWDDGPQGGFTDGIPWLPVGPEVETRNVSVQKEDPGSLLNLYKKLIALRRDNPVLQEGSYCSLKEGVPYHCFLYLRELNGTSVMVALNFSIINQEIMLTKGDSEFEILLSTDSQREDMTTGSHLKLGPGEGCIIKIS